ncbi:fas-associated death domain protein [Leptidea sinapis]|uniref:Death domain-containing protein n=1 Tax=Leptidea sinapis TaxID=189913 RepID=A0A5E4R0S9_9NEOP|nr:fas-associated death domain protein [Leptidea sinapis]VVD03881.1 unnamed protein product [Leptidea sinapis]
MTLSEYDQLKNHIIYYLGLHEDHSSLLTVLKEFYKDDIDSPRRYEKIKTIRELLHLLEIRYVLSEANLTPLKEICYRASDNHLLQRVLDYEQLSASKGKDNNCYYDLKNDQTYQTTTTGHHYGNISDHKKNRINQIIIEEIGSYWRNLARNLRVQEQIIDEIESKYKAISEKASKLLEFYETRADPQRGFYVLCNALEKSRRKDISKSIQEVMLMNI